MRALIVRPAKTVNNGNETLIINPPRVIVNSPICNPGRQMNSAQNLNGNQGAQNSNGGHNVNGSPGGTQNVDLNTNACMNLQNGQTVSLGNPVGN